MNREMVAVAKKKAESDQKVGWSGVPIKPQIFSKTIMWTKKTKNERLDKVLTKEVLKIILLKMLQILCNDQQEMSLWIPK